MSLTNWLSILLRRPFWVVLSGAGFAQAIGVLAAPLLTRLYSPEAFGLLTIFSTMLGLTSAFIGGRYEYAIVGEQDDRQADLLVVLVTVVAVLMTSLSAIVSASPAWRIPSDYRLVLPSLWVASGAYVIGTACTNWLVRRGMFSAATALRVFRGGATVLLSVCFFTTSMGLVWGAAVAYIFLAVAGFYSCIRRSWSLHGISFLALLVMARKYFKFPAQSALPAIFDNLSLLIPIYWASMLFSSEEVGQWGLSRMVLAVPISMVAASMAQVLMKRLHDLVAARQSINGLLRGILIRIGLLSLFLCIAVTALGETAFGLIFGEKWVVAGALSAWLIWAYAINAMCSMLSTVFIVFRNLALNGVWQIVHCAAIYLLFTSQKVSNFDRLIHLFVMVELISYAVYALMVFYACKHYGDQLKLREQIA